MFLINNFLSDNPSTFRNQYDFNITNLVTKVRVDHVHLQLKSYDKKDIDFYFDGHNNLSSLKDDVYFGLAASVNKSFSG